ncbi:hypothetical protein BV20DRAFT_949862 [Pilatotrama ljubarskyi]|nr:hypothetical protein BV20DRAFT_949862 [Pilatotrama ljubarskyi]
MHHFCLICKSPFLSDVREESEAVVTSCGHVYHRDCVQSRPVLENGSCEVCRSSLHQENRVKKLFLLYHEDESDQRLVDNVKRYGGMRSNHRG